MGADQSTQLPAGAPGSRIKSQRDEDIPYTSYSISKPIAGGNNYHRFRQTQFFSLGQKKKYVCLLFDENLKQGR